MKFVHCVSFFSPWMDSIFVKEVIQQQRAWTVQYCTAVDFFRQAIAPVFRPPEVHLYRACVYGVCARFALMLFTRVRLCSDLNSDTKDSPFARENIGSHSYQQYMMGFVSHEKSWCESETWREKHSRWTWVYCSTDVNFSSSVEGVFFRLFGYRDSSWFRFDSECWESRIMSTDTALRKQGGSTAGFEQDTDSSVVGSPTSEQRPILAYW